MENIARKAIRIRRLSEDKISLTKYQKDMSRFPSSQPITRAQLWQFMETEGISVRTLHKAIPNFSLKRIRELADRGESPDEIFPNITIATLATARLNIERLRQFREKFGYSKIKI